MGLLRHLFGRTASSRPIPAVRRLQDQSRDARTPAHADATIVAPELEGLVKLTGTTTFAKQAATDLLERYSQHENGYLEIVGFLQRETENTADPLAVAVHAEGERVAYLPGYLAARLSISPGDAHPLALQFFSAVAGEGLRIEGWAWLGDSEPQWKCHRPIARL